MIKGPQVGGPFLEHIMGLKKNVQLSDQAVAFIEVRRAPSDADGDRLGWSAGVNQAIGDLSWLLRELVPTLNDKTWMVLFDAYAGHFFDGARITPYRLASDVMDHYGVLSIDELEPSISDAVRQLHKLTQPQQHAATEVARLFWVRSGHWSGEITEIVKQIRAEL